MNAHRDRIAETERGNELELKEVQEMFLWNPGTVNSTPHTSHFLVFHGTHFNVTLTLAQEQGVWRALHTGVIFMRSCCVA